MRLGILSTGEATAYTLARHGSYVELFQELLAEPGVHWDIFDSQRGERPQRVKDYHGLVITGSAATAHETLSWILSLNALIREIVDQGVKLLGVCFGHQVVANALGGRSEINPAGWEIGLHQVTTTQAISKNWYVRDAEPCPGILESHRDHVAELPAGAELLAYSEQTPVQMFAVGDRVLCMQGHPEFNNDIVRDLVESRGKEGVISPATAAKALGSLRRQPSRDQWAKLLRRFLYDRDFP